MMEDLSYKLGEYISAVRYEDLAPQTVASAKRSTLDTLGAMLAGSTAPGIATIVELVRGWGGTGEASLVGHGDRLPAPHAVLCNGSMARALEIDDCVDFLPVHPSASTVPALLALAESRGGLSGRDFLTALALGQDLIIRLGMTVRQNAMQSGRNNLFKIFGPTAALARALGFAPEQARNALGLAFSFAVGDGQCAIDGALSLRLQQGIVAQGALMSVLLGERGFTGAKDFLLGKYGYLRAFEPEPLLENLMGELGRRFHGERISIKPYSACRANHSAIELALQLRAETEVNARSVRRIDVQVCPEVYHLVGAPHESKIKPESAPAAQFSLQFTVAAALLRGDFFLDELRPEVIHDQEILDLAGRVHVAADPALRSDFVLGRTVMEFELDGRSPIRKEIELPLGNPSHPMDYEQCAQKFVKGARYATQPPEQERLEEVVQLVSRLEELPDVSVLTSRLN